MAEHPLTVVPIVLDAASDAGNIEPGERAQRGRRPGRRRPRRRTADGNWRGPGRRLGRRGTPDGRRRWTAGGWRWRRLHPPRLQQRPSLGVPPPIGAGYLLDIRCCRKVARGAWQQRLQCRAAGGSRTGSRPSEARGSILGTPCGALSESGRVYERFHSSQGPPGPVSGGPRLRLVWPGAPGAALAPLR